MSDSDDLPKPTPFGNHLGFYRPHPLGGDQYHFGFENRYGASVVRFTTPGGSGSYGHQDNLWELAVLYNTDPDAGANPAGANFAITYNTDITSDVLGWLSANDVVEVLDRISRLGSAEAIAKDHHQ